MLPLRKKGDPTLWVKAAGLVAAVLCGLAAARSCAGRGMEAKVLGLDRVIAFTFIPTKDFDPKQLHSVTSLDQPSRKSGDIGEREVLWRASATRG